MIDWSIRAGDLLILAGLAGTAVTYAFRSGRIAEMIDNMQARIGILEDTTRQIAEVVTKQAVQNERLDNLSGRMNRIDDNIEDLRRGRGYINNKEQKTVNNEY